MPNEQMSDFISLEDLSVNLERYFEEQKITADEALELKQVITHYDILQKFRVSRINIKKRLAMTDDEKLILLDDIIKVNVKEDKDRQLEKKGYQYVNKKAGFLEMGMLIDVLIISVALILLIMIIMGTR